MRIVMVSSEAAPFAKTGGLADAVWAMCQSLAQRGNHVTLVIPHYRWNDLANTVCVATHTVPGMADATYTLNAGSHEGVEMMFVSSPPISGRNGIYGDRPDTEYPDNALRFAVLGHAGYQVAVCNTGEPTVLHGHDWSAGIALGFRCAESTGHPASSPATVLTVHNAAYEGRFSKPDLLYTGIPARCSGIESGTRLPDETVSFLEIGLRNADRVTTVSPTYAKDIESGLASPTLGRVFGKVGVTGILNGVDYSVWNPAVDRLIPANYDVDRLEAKEACRRELERQTGFAPDPASPVISTIARLVPQKGLEELCFPNGGALAGLDGLGARYIILGSGDERYEAALRELSDRYDWLSVHITYDEGFAHLIEAGSDFFLMPSSFEPCGLNQLYSIRYGTVPIVHATGGLADTIHDVRLDPDKANGYCYESQDPATIVRTVEEAIGIWRNHRELHHAMMTRGMRERHGWELRAEEYESIYRSLRNDG